MTYQFFYLQYLLVFFFANRETSCFTNNLPTTHKTQPNCVVIQVTILGIICNITDTARWLLDGPINLQVCLHMQCLTRNDCSNSSLQKNGTDSLVQISYSNENALFCQSVSFVGAVPTWSAICHEIFQLYSCTNSLRMYLCSWWKLSWYVQPKWHHSRAHLYMHAIFCNLAIIGTDIIMSSFSPSPTEFATVSTVKNDRICWCHHFE